MGLFLPPLRFSSVLFVCVLALAGTERLHANSTEALPLTEALAASGFKSFAAIVSASGLQKELGETGFTCFAPIDVALAAMPSTQLQSLRDDPKGVNTLRWIKYHFIKSELCKKSDLGIVREIITWAGQPSYLSITPTKMTLNDTSNIVKFDLAAKNGIIHGISKALNPNSQDGPDGPAK